MMSEIYSRCSSLIIWLSSDSSEFCVAVDELRHELRQIPAAHRSQNMFVDDPRQKPVARPLSTLLRDSYFTRLWIVQEVLLARKISVFCRGVSGPVWISWGDLCKSVAGNRLWLRRMGYPESVITLLHDGHSVYSLIESLNWCIENFSGNACKDPRDKVYGLLGHVPAEDRVLFEIDYGKFGSRGLHGSRQRHISYTASATVSVHGGIFELRSATEEFSGEHVSQ